MEISHSAHAILKRQLEDYETTRFKDVEYHTYIGADGRHVVLCGEMKEQNRFGGYGEWGSLILDQRPDGAVTSVTCNTPQWAETLLRDCDNGGEDGWYDFSDVIKYHSSNVAPPSIGEGKHDAAFWERQSAASEIILRAEENTEAGRKALESTQP